MSDLFNIDLTLSELAKTHKEWLSLFRHRHLQNWERLAKGNYESAMCEAVIRHMLQSLGVEVSPNEELKEDQSGPDFKCVVKETVFYVEAACLERDTVTRKTGIENSIIDDAASINSDGMRQAIEKICKSKAKQCADVAWPTLIAIGSFHLASQLFLHKPLIETVLIGKPSFQWNANPSSGMPMDDLTKVTRLENASFLRLNEEGADKVRNSISGLLICSLNGGSCIGVLHPEPERPFDPATLPNVEFGLLEIDHGRLQVHWNEHI